MTQAINNKTLGKTLILGVGNILRCDDGVGPRVIELLQQTKACKEFNCDLVDGATDGLALLDVISKYERAIIIDAVDMGAAPGEVRVFDPEQAVLHIKGDTLSTHGFGLAEVITFLQQLSITTKLTIIGIQPKDISFGEDLSMEIAAKLTFVADLVLKQLHSCYLSA